MATTLIEKETFISKAIDFSNSPPDTPKMWEAIVGPINGILAENTANNDEKLSSAQTWYARCQFAELLMALAARSRKAFHAEEAAKPATPRKAETPKAAKTKEVPDYMSFVGKAVDAMWDATSYFAATLNVYDPTHIDDVFGLLPFKVTWEDKTVDWVAKVRQVGGAAIPKVKVHVGSNGEEPQPEASPGTSLADKLRESAPPKKKGQPPADTAALVKLAAEAVKARDASLKKTTTTAPAPMKKGDRKALVACSDAILMQVAAACGTEVPETEKLTAAQRGALLAELKEAGFTEAEWFSANTVGPYQEPEEEAPTPKAKPAKKSKAKVVAPPPEKPTPAKAKGAPAPKPAPAKAPAKVVKAKVAPAKTAPAPKAKPAKVKAVA